MAFFNLGKLNLRMEAGSGNARKGLFRALRLPCAFFMEGLTVSGKQGYYGRQVISYQLSTLHRELKGGCNESEMFNRRTFIVCCSFELLT